MLKARNVTNALPKSAQPGATKAIQEICNAEDRAHAEKTIEVFAKTYGANRVRPGPLACDHRSPPGAPGPRGRPLRERRPGRTGGGCRLIRPHATGDNYPVTCRVHQAGYANEISN